MKHLALTLLLTSLASPVWSDLQIKFVEGAPKDRFDIEYTGGCTLADVDVEIDLGASAAGLIFDTDPTGAGVEVYQPLEFVFGEDALKEPPNVQDGDSIVTLNLRSLSPGSRISFTIDVDDTLGTKPTMIAGGEIAGAEVRLMGSDVPLQAVFNSRAETTVTIEGCSA